MAGVDLRTVAQLMGHGTIQMTMCYSHLALYHEQNAVSLRVKLSGATSEQSSTSSSTGTSDRQ